MARTRKFDTERVLDAAVSQFRTSGYAGTSVDELVDATGIGRGSLYGAFVDKAGLYLAALDRYRENYADPFLRVANSDAPARDSLRELLVGVVDEIVNDDLHRSCLMVSAATETLAHNPKVAERVRATTSSLEEALTSLIARADTPEHPLSGSPRELASFFMMTINGLRVAGAITPDRQRLMSMAEVALRAI